MRLLFLLAGAIDINRWIIIQFAYVYVYILNIKGIIYTFAI